MRSQSSGAALLAGAFMLAGLGFPASSLAQTTDSFQDKIEPILKQNCLPCHSAQTRTNGLSVVTEQDLLTGGERGTPIEPGNPGDSLLIKILRGTVEPRMPMGGKPLSDDKIESISNWIKGLKPADVPTASGPPATWAFKPAKKVEPPAVKNTTWVRNGIDNFVLQKLEEKGLSPAPEASPQTLLRRVYLDLIGLPPTPAEASAFLNDKSPNAYEKLVDKLLADPRYGERWGRHWLDLARYADTRGYEGDPEFSHAWRYRDYVIRAFNTDKPYDRFVKEQIAGDEMGAGGDDDDGALVRRARRMSPDGEIGVGFLRLAPWNPGGAPSIQTRQVLLDEMTATVGSVFLGLTVKCAQCHNHKYDPISQKDYYRLQAFFAPIELVNAHVDFTDPAMKAEMAEKEATAKAKLKKAQDEFDAYQDSLLAKLRDLVAKGSLKAAVAAGTNEAPVVGGVKSAPVIKADLTELTRRLVRNDNGVTANFEDTTFTVQEKQKYLALLALVDTHGQEPGLLVRQAARYEPVAQSVRNFSASPMAPNRPITHVLLNGEYDKLGPPVEPGFLSAITGNSDPAPLPTEGVGNVSRYRSVLADWIASPDNPLTARVMVNRIWQWHFGVGIVATSSDFGRNGARPTNLDLLNWLSFQFSDKNWSIKDMQRLIMLSSTYRQSSEYSNPADLKTDPTNTMLWRMNRTRAEGEVLRDSILEVSGRLDSESGGPAIFPPVPDEVANLKIKGRLVWEPDNGPEGRRRSVYIMQRRQLEVPFLSVTDAGVLNDSCPRRFVSITPLQSLTLMDGQLVNEEAKYFAQRVAEQAGSDPANQIRLAFQLALVRSPEPSELAKAEEYFKSGGDLMGLCRIIYNTNEFVYVR